MMVLFAVLKYVCILLICIVLIPNAIKYLNFKCGTLLVPFAIITFQGDDVTIVIFMENGNVYLCDIFVAVR